jgi:putative membrane protein
VLRTLVNLVRGALIGLAEVVPGVSGGTVALIVGVYHTLIGSAAAVVRSVVALVRGHREEAAEHWRPIPWAVLLPLLAAMLAAVLVGAAVLEPLLEEYPQQARAVFFGLVVVGIAVPARMVHRWDASAYALAAAGAVAAFVLTGLPPGTVADPAPWQIVCSAALAICALVLPGVSGSFLLLTFGMYEPTIAALNARDFGYILLFILGATIGLSTFVLVLQWLLRHRPRPTLIVITGLMVGSLRALWPWQDEDRTLLPPTGPVVPLVLLAVAGGVAVLVLLIVERRLGMLLDEVVEEEAPATRPPTPRPHGES